MIFSVEKKVRELGSFALSQLLRQFSMGALVGIHDHSFGRNEDHSWRRVAVVRHLVDNLPKDAVFEIRLKLEEDDE